MVMRYSREAFDWSTKSAEQGYAPAQYQLAKMYAENAVPDSMEVSGIPCYEQQVRDSFQNNISAVDVTGQYSNGAIEVINSSNGYDRPLSQTEQAVKECRDYNSSLAHNRREANKERNKREAAEWFQKAAEQGFPPPK